MYRLSLILHLFACTLVHVEPNKYCDPLLREDQTVLAVVRREAGERWLEIRSLPDLRESTFSLKVQPGPIALFPLSFDLVRLRVASKQQN